MNKAGTPHETTRLHERVAELETALRTAEERLNLRTRELADLNDRLQRERSQRNPRAAPADIAATREAEQRFHDASALNEAIIGAAPIGIAACNASGQCIFANPAMSRMVNASTDQILRQNIAVFAAWRQPQLLAAANATLLTRVSHSGVIAVPDAPGRERWLEYSFTRFQRVNEPHLLIVFHDITERRQAEEQVRQTELRYRALAESIPDMIYVMEPDGRVLYANTLAAKQFNLTAADLVGKRQQDLFSPDVAERHCRAIQAVAASGTPFAVEVPDTLDVGKPVWIDTRLIPIRDPNGTVAAVLGISRDVTERRLMMMSVQESEKRYRQLFESLTEGCTLYDLVYDDAGVPVDVLITAINPAGAAIMGFDPAALVGRRASELVPGKKPLFLDIYVELDRGGPPVSTETRLDFIGKDLRLSFSCPRKGMVAAIYTDITARKEAEAQMLQYQQRLRHLAAEIATAGEQERRRIAVELHDGLGQGLVLCKMKLESAKVEAEGAGLRRQIQASVRLVEEAIRDTRSLTFQLSPPVLHEIGLAAAIEWLAEHLGEAHGMDIRVTRNSAREPAVTAIRGILFQAVRELTFNAIKHARAKVIAIDIRVARGHLAIKVKDDGVGFEAGAQEGSTRRGMGLFNIRERMQLIGGTMTIESRRGKGTTAKLVAPLDEPPVEDAKGDSHEHPHLAV